MKLFKPFYSIQIGYAVMMIIETTSYGLGGSWLVMGTIGFGFFTILNLILEINNNIKSIK